MAAVQIVGFEALTKGSYQTTSGSCVSFYHNCGNHERPGVETPILILTHGYPESGFAWRHVVPRLVSQYALFIPDQPGYGDSTPSQAGDDHLTVGTALLEAFSSVYPSSFDDPVKVALIGHDRGGRTMHRLAVDKDDFRHLHILGLLVFDIVPYIEEYTAFKDPRAAVGSFHWSLLPNVDLAVPMIMGYGGGKFCREIIKRGAGPNAVGRNLLLNDGAVDAYASFFDKEEVVRASAQDYAEGADKDYADQDLDQAVGRKLTVPTFVVYSEYNLGSRFNVRKVWKEYVEHGTDLRVQGIREGCGHFIVEEAPEKCSEFIEMFAKSSNIAFSSLKGRQ